jgi:hypothetical protein
MIGGKDLSWIGNQLYFGRRKVLRVVPDERYPGLMWRVERPDGSLSDMANLTWAKDAAIAIACSILNRRTKNGRAVANRVILGAGG